MLAKSGVGTDVEIAEAEAAEGGLGVLIRSLIGLERGAVEEASADFLAGTTYSAEQIDFVHLVVENLTYNGDMMVDLLWSPPFTDDAPGGPDDVFDGAQVDQIIDRVRHLDATAEVAAS